MTPLLHKLRAFFHRAPSTATAIPRTSLSSLKPSRPALTPHDSSATVRGDSNASLPIPAAAKKNPDNEKGQAVVLRELLDSERRYVYELRRTIKVIIKPLRRSKVLTSRDVAVLFANMEDILAGHERLLRLCNSRNPSIPELLTELAKVLALYPTYVRNLPRAQARLQVLQTRPSFAQTLDTTIPEVVPDHLPFGMGGFMLMPLQRVYFYEGVVGMLVEGVGVGEEVEAVRVAAARVEKAVERALSPSVWETMKMGWRRK
ncbi:hypothetical protein HDU96_006005 [Phlyctochytrium bullatum]|nr:hypothetical protein HDU96_006005 [Phlyctochytrium bullatum]